MHQRQYLTQTRCRVSIRSTVPAAFRLPSVSRQARAPQQQTVVAFSSSGYRYHAAGPHTKGHIQQLNTLQGHHTPEHTTTTTTSSSSSSTVKTTDTSREIQQHGDDDPGWMERIDSGSAPQEPPTSEHDKVPRRRRIPTDDAAAGETSEFPQYGQSPESYANVRSRGLPRRSGLAPGVKRTGEAVEVLVARQLRDLMKNPIPGIQVEPDEDSVMIWHAQVEGPAGSPYEGGKFRVDVIFDDGFPGTQPKLRFLTKLWHPNISGSNICVAFGTDESLRRGSKGKHQVRSAACVLIGVQWLLSSPNARDAMTFAGYQLQTNPDLYIQQAREWTKKYAMDGCEADVEGKQQNSGTGSIG